MHWLLDGKAQYEWLWAHPLDTFFIIVAVAVVGSFTGRIITAVRNYR